jgi:hypothetical protein
VGRLDIWTHFRCYRVFVQMHKPIHTYRGRE